MKTKRDGIITMDRSARRNFVSSFIATSRSFHQNALKPAFGGSYTQLTILGMSFGLVSTPLGTHSVIFENFFKTYGKAICNINQDGRRCRDAYCTGSSLRSLKTNRSPSRTGALTGQSRRRGEITLTPSRLSPKRFLLIEPG